MASGTPKIVPVSNNVTPLALESGSSLKRLPFETTPSQNERKQIKSIKPMPIVLSIKFDKMLGVFFFVYIYGHL